MAIKVGTLQVDLISNTASFTGPLDKAGQQAKRTAKDIQEGFNGMDLGEARGSIMVLGEEVGIHLPRHVQAFIATLPGVGAAMNAAFPILAVVAIGVAIFEAAEKLAKLGEEAKKIAQDQTNLGTAINSAFNSLDGKLLQAGIHTDELNQNHLAALKKQLELIDLQSMDELAHTFDTLVKATDKSFDSLKAHWYELGVGSEGARNALTTFQVQYNALLAQRDGKGASDLLAGTLASAEEILKFQKQYIANKAKASDTNDSDPTGQRAAKFDEAFRALQKKKALSTFGVSDDELKSQEALVNTLRAQVSVQGDIAKLDDSEKGNKKRDDLRQTIALLDKQYATEKQGTQAQTKEALAAYQVEFDQGKITAEQLADLKQQALDKEYTAELAHLERIRALEAREPALRKQTDEQIAALNANHQAQTLTTYAATLAKQEELNKSFYLSTLADSNQVNAEIQKSFEAPNKAYIESLAAQRSAAKQHADAMGGIEEQSLQFKREMGLISEADYEAEMQTELNVTYMTARKELQAKREATVAGTADRVKADAQLQALEDKYQKDSERNEQQSLLRRTSAFRGMMRDWQDLSKQMGQSFMQTLNSMNSSVSAFLVTGQGGFRQLATSAIEEIIKIGLQWVESKLLMLATGKVAGAQEIMTQAAIAGAGGTASMAAAPFPLDMTAPAFGAAMMGNAMSYLGMLSAERGALLPDQEMLVHTHPKEMILPQNISNFIVGAASAASGSGNGGDQNHFVFAPTIHAVDAEGVDRMLTKHADTFHRHVRAHMRRLNYA